MSSERAPSPTRSATRSTALTPAPCRCAPSGSADGSVAQHAFEDQAYRREQVELERPLGRVPTGRDHLSAIDRDLRAGLELELEDLDVIALALPVLDLVVD